METITKNILTIVLASGLFFLNIVKSPSINGGGACDAAPRTEQAIVTDYSFRFDGKHTFITLDISKPVRHDIQSAGRNVIVIILKDSTLGEIDHKADVDNDTLKNIVFSETTIGDVKIILSLKNRAAVNVRKATKPVAQHTRQDKAELRSKPEAVFRLFIDIYPKAKMGGGTKSPSSSSKNSPPSTRRSSAAQKPKATPESPKLPDASQTKTNLIPEPHSEGVGAASAPENEKNANAVENQKPNPKLAALHKSIDELKGQEAKDSNADSLPDNASGFPTPKLIGDINPLWYLQFFIDIILVLSIMILWRKYTRLNKQKKEFKTILAEAQNSPFYDDNGSPELSASLLSHSSVGMGLKQPVSEIPSFNQEVQTTHHLDIEVGNDGYSKGGGLEKNAPGQTSQVTEQPQKSPRNLANKKNQVTRLARVDNARSEERNGSSGAPLHSRTNEHIRPKQNDNSKAKKMEAKPSSFKPPKKAKSLRPSPSPRAEAELSKNELQAALAKISSRIEQLMVDKKDERKHPPPENDATSIRETIKRLAKDGMDVNSISQKMGVPSGEVELILNLSDDK